MQVGSETARGNDFAEEDASTVQADTVTENEKNREFAEHTFQVIRRNGSVAKFDASKILAALTKAFLAVEGNAASNSRRVHDTVADLTDQIVTGLTQNAESGVTLHIDHIQDEVERALMRAEHHKVARAYVLYREDRARERAMSHTVSAPVQAPVLRMKIEDGSMVPLDLARLEVVVAEACAGLADVDSAPIMAEAQRNLYDGISRSELALSPILATRTLIEKEPNYSKVSARLLLDKTRTEVLSFISKRPDQATQKDMETRYAEYFHDYIRVGIAAEQLDPELAQFDVERMASALKPERDLQFDYLGLQTLYDRYFLHIEGTRYELPQAFFMRVAMGLALREIDREASAIEFYELLSSFDFMASTPTLFNSGTTRSQLSSCFLTTVSDDLDGIFKAIKDNALLAKYSGGLGNDWTQVRGLKSRIKGTNGESQGVVPFLKVANDTAIAVNQCFAPATLVRTSKGAKPIASIKTGDLVLGVSGTYREVLKTFVYDQDGPMVSVDVKHSMEPLTVTSGHPFYAITGIPLEESVSRQVARIKNGTARMGWVDASNLSKGDYVAQTIPTEIVQAEGINEEDAFVYGLLLGDGHRSSNGYEWGVSGDPRSKPYLGQVVEYLETRGIHYWKTERDESYVQIKWASGHGAVRDGSTGRIVHAGAPTLPFTHDDLYGQDGKKRIAPRLSHLPHAQTEALIHGLLASDGNVSRGVEITFSSSSNELAEGLRLQCLRLGIPTSGHSRLRQNDHDGIRSDGTVIYFRKKSEEHVVRVPAFAAIADRLGIPTITKQNWLTVAGHVFSRIVSIEACASVPVVHDLIVEGDESYMTVAGLAHNGGKRKGAVCAYLETWHIDIEEFLDLRKNTGDDRRRTHDMNTANWVPDLFMQRMMADEMWTLFSPNDTPDLHDLYGTAFKTAYEAHEARVARGDVKLFRQIRAVDLWRKMLTMIFETGHPWITWKDPCNIRSPQQHVGVVHSSNLCTEITLNTSASEVAVCNLGSVNLPNHVTAHGLDFARMERTINTAMRMLDNVIDINFYTIPEARRSNLRHRPVGLGIMGFHDAIQKLRLAYSSKEAVDFADKSMEAVSYYAISASVDLAAQRGRYPSFEGSLWSKGILPIDSIEMLSEARGGLEMDRSSTLDWDSLRERVVSIGMRNSNTMAIAPTATISNICGVSQSIEPVYQNLYVKSNMSGDFTVVNTALVHDLKKLGLWDEVMVSDLKYFDGTVAEIARIPEELKVLYATAFEIDCSWLVEAASRRQKWIDQAQSLNLYIANPSGRKLDTIYRLAWQRGLKTTYYLRARSASHVEKSTVKKTDGKLNAVSVSPASSSPTMASLKQAAASYPSQPSGPEEICEACQ